MEKGTYIEERPAEPLPTVPESIELTLTFTPEQAAVIVERLTAIFEKIVQLVTKAAERASEVIRKLVADTTRKAAAVMDAMLYEVNDHPRWWHLYKHAKKARTRKKYRRRLMQQLLRKL